MSTRYKIALACYFMAGLGSVVFGIRYFFAVEFMPYHASAMNLPWETLSLNQQMTFITLYRAVGTGMLTTAVAIGFILFIQFRRGDNGSRWALTAVGVCSDQELLSSKVRSVRAG